MEYSAVFGCCKDFFLELDTTQTFLRDVLCPVRGSNEHLLQIAELFETNAYKLSRTSHDIFDWWPNMDCLRSSNIPVRQLPKKIANKPNSELTFYYKPET